MCRLEAKQSFLLLSQCFNRRSLSSNEFVGTLLRPRIRMRFFKRDAPSQAERSGSVDGLPKPSALAHCEFGESVSD